LKIKHITHKSHEWFEAIDSDPDVDFETGEYVGISDMIKLSDGNWYRQNECIYLDSNGVERMCV